jgi:hypothetical protein
LFIYIVALTCIFDLIVVSSLIMFRLSHLAQDVISWSMYIETLTNQHVHSGEDLRFVEVTNEAN